MAKDNRQQTTAGTSLVNPGYERVADALERIATALERLPDTRTLLAAIAQAGNAVGVNNAVKAADALTVALQTQYTGVEPRGGK